MRSSDLHVERSSNALNGLHLDVVVSGSIGAVESVRFIRALRRLGAEVTPWLTRGGAQFITETSLAWAAGRDVRSSFAGDASHIACADACIVAPASANLIAKVAHGLTDSPASALISSYLGMGKPVLALANMHESLAAAPAAKANMQTLLDYGVISLEPRLEEGKRKFPDPATLADEVAHALKARQYHANGQKTPSVVITMGSTRGYIDDVRYISNYSSGRLGALIAEELYRFGVSTHVACGSCQVQPRVYGTLSETLTNDEMERAATMAVSQGARGAVFAASVLDFIPKTKKSGKISSKEPGLTVEFQPTRKIIAAVDPKSGPKVGFKLETGLTLDRAKTLARDYMAAYGLSLMVLNDLADVDRHRHKALVFEAKVHSHEPDTWHEVEGKETLARVIAAHVLTKLALRENES